jgi:two-component system sensor histidine kinase AlgZ
LVLGGLAGLAGSAILVQPELHVPAAAAPTGRLPAALGPMLAGAALAAVVFQWLRMRAQALLPAETTARLAELQSRIRPHFLFNTLNTALALVRLDPARAEGVLEDLAELFRVALTESGASVTLAEEVALAQRYLAIEQIRFGNRLRVSWELDPDADVARMPPLLLQPLVENAVRHGVEPAPAGGTIRIRTRVKSGRAVIVIENTVPTEPSRPGNGMALKNVRERLNLMHDVAAQFDTRSAPNLFRVQIGVPL